MILQACLFLLAVLWFARRLRLVLQTPIYKLVQKLNIEIPKIPIVSINEISSNKVCFQWEATLEKGGAGNRYQVYLNDTKVAVTNQISCILENLKPDSYYQIEVIAILASGYRSKSSCVFVKTYKQKSIDDYSAHENPQNIVTFLTTDVASNEPHLDIFKHKNNGAAANLRSRSNTFMLGSSNVPPIIFQDREAHISDDLELMIKRRMKEIESLKETLESGQEELRDLTLQEEKIEEEFASKKEALTQERDRQRDIKKSGDRTRQSIKSEGKLLEDNVRYAKKDLKTIEDKINEAQSFIRSKTAEMEKWSTDLKNIHSKKENLASSAPQQKKKLQKQIKLYGEKLKKARESSLELEELSKQWIAKRRSKEKHKEELLLLVKTLENGIKQDGTIDPHLLPLCDQFPGEIGSVLKNEFESDIKAQEVWEEHQKQKVMNCNSAYADLHTIKTELESLTSKKLEKTLESINKDVNEREKQQELQRQQIQQQIQNRAQLPMASFNAPFYQSANVGPVNSNSFGVASPLTPTPVSSQPLMTPTNTYWLDSLNSGYQNTSPEIYNSAPKIDTSASTSADADGIAELDSPTADLFLPKNLLDSSLNETLLADMKQYRQTITDQPSPVQYPVQAEHHFSPLNSVVKNPLAVFSHRRSTSGKFSSNGSSDFQRLSENDDDRPLVLQSVDYIPEQGNQNNSYSITQALSPKRLFSFNRRQSSIGKNDVMFGDIVNSNSAAFPDSETKSNGSKFFYKKNSAGEIGSFEDKNDGNGGTKVSRFFSVRKNETSKLPTLSIDTTPTKSDETSSKFELSEFSAPNTALRVRDRSGSINSGLSLPQSFHSAQVVLSNSLNPIPTNNSVWGQSNVSSSSFFYPTTSNTMSNRGPSFDSDNIFSATSQDASLNNFNNSAKPFNGWSLFHINKNNIPSKREHKEEVITEEAKESHSPFLNDTIASPKSGSGRKSFFRKEKSSQIEPEAEFVESPQEGTNPLSSPTQKKRKSIFLFSKSNKNEDLMSSPNMAMKPNESTSSLDNTDDDEASSDDEGVAPVQGKSSKTSKFIPKSMRGLGIARKNSVASSVGMMIDQSGGDHTSLSTSSRSINTDGNIPAISE